MTLSLLLSDQECAETRGEPEPEAGCEEPPAVRRERLLILSLVCENRGRALLQVPRN
jgi:hypothetical protein